MNEQALMQRAVDLSLLGMGLTYPNPIVGAVIADRSGKILAEGFHQGKEHAERLALEELKRGGTSFADLTLFLTLEPCNHQGKTPPCSEMLIEEGVALGINRVVYAISDPNPIAEGGAERIQAADLKAERLEIPSAKFANRDWLTKIEIGRPRITWKIAASLDGAIAAEDGSSKWITNESSRKDVKVERSRADALLTSTETVLTDNPSMLGASKNPVRIIMGERVIPKSHAIFSGDTETITISSRSTDDLLALCKERGFNRVFLESGPKLGAALYKAGLIDEILLYQAPTILGSNRRFTKGIDLTSIDQQIRLRSEEINEFSSDIKRLLFIDNELNRGLSCSLA